jgi:hypothetical protein
MRSCEYLEVTGERRTKCVTVSGVRFFHDRRELPHSSSRLHLADSVSITFEFQKNDERNETVTMHRSGDPVLCPVLVWAAVIYRLRSYDGFNPAMKVNTFKLPSGELSHLPAATALIRLRATVGCIGKAILGYGPLDVGLHSIRSGAAMAMYLAGVPVYTIMLIGRWSSDAFLRYIRKQVQEFSSGVSQRMVLTPDFFTIPDAAAPGLEDPRAPNNRHNFSGRGLQFGLSNQSRALQPAALSLHH